MKKKIKTQEDVWMDQFAKDAKYHRTSPTPYSIRYKGTFFSAKDPKELFAKYKQCRREELANEESLNHKKPSKT